MSRLLFLILVFFSYNPLNAQPRLDSNSLAPAQVPVNHGTQAIGPQGREGAFYKEQVYMIPHKYEQNRRIAAFVYKGGSEPRPLIIMTHGTQANPKENQNWKLGLYPHAIEWWIREGYNVAVVQRRGFGLTGGEPPVKFSCALAPHAQIGENAADDIISAIEYLTQQPFISSKQVIGVGQSTGGWTMVSLAAKNHPQVKATINFSGGQRGISGQTKQSCGFDELARDASLFGLRAKTKSLWIYTKNDLTFPIDIIERVHKAYKSAGAPLEFHLLEPFGKDGHSLLPSPNGVPFWNNIVRNYVKSLQ